MAKIWIDGASYEIGDGDNLLHACLSLGVDLPYFCWHPALGSVGACRQCAVKQLADEDDEKGKIVMACMTAAEDGTRISVADPEARELRSRVIEWLMTNHPHDCPVCDEGGECHLQDMTVMTGHNYRRFRFRKRTHRNQDLGPFIRHEMNRCIACYRCVRYYREYAGGRDLDVFSAHNHVYFGRAEDGVLESEFSGNLVEVCPTGVFTDKTLSEHYTRKWDLESAPSVCVHCGLGCNTLAGERHGVLRRILNRYNREVNGYFLCDRGRFGYGFVNGERRVRHAYLRQEEGGELVPVGREEALSRQAAHLASRERLLGIGSPRASLEANFALRRLVGAERFHLGVSTREHRLLEAVVEALAQGPVPTPSLREARRADAVFLLGEDPTATAPLLALALRQAARRRPLAVAGELGIPPWHDAAVREATQEATGPFFIAAPGATRLDDVATATLRRAPAELAALGTAVARELDPEAPDPGQLPAETRELAATIASALTSAEHPLVVSGTGAGSREVIEAAAAVARALYRRRGGSRAETVRLALTVPEANSLGLALLGGGSLEAALLAVAKGEVDTVIVLENDLYRRADRQAVDAFLSDAPAVLVLDHTAHDTASAASAVLPAATFAEGDGTLVSSEGRAQRYYQALPPAGDVRESWRWLADLAGAAGRDGLSEWQALDDVAAALVAELPLFRPLAELAPRASFRVAGQKVPRQPFRASGRTSMEAARTVHEPPPPADPDSPLAFSMEGTPNPPPSLTAFYWAPGWNSVQSLNKFQQEVGGPLRGGDPGRRLLEPGAMASRTAAELRGERKAAAPGAPLRARRRRDREGLRLVPLHHTFGSEELSALAPAVAERTPEPYLALHPDDAREIAQGGELPQATVTVGDRTERLPVELRPDLPRGTAGLAVGLPGSGFWDLPAWGRVSP